MLSSKHIGMAIVAVRNDAQAYDEESLLSVVLNTDYGTRNSIFI